jgi:dienelactone hydrolase
LRDPERAWPATADPSGRQGRPVQILLWYPAEDSDGPTLTVEDYVRADWTGTFATTGWTETQGAALTEARRAFEEGLDAPLDEGQWARGRSARGRARPEAGAASGRRALLLFEGGLNGRSYMFAPLAEMLASHGYVVASLGSLGRSESERLGFDLEGLRAQVEDMKMALRVLQARPEVDTDRIALLGWSAGGVSQAHLCLETPETFRAAVSLDSGTGYAYGADLLRQAGGVDPRRLSVPFLHMDAGIASATVPRDDSFLRAHGWAPVGHVTVAGLRHGDIALPYGVGRAAALGNEWQPGLRTLGEGLLDFLARHVPADHTAERVLLASRGWRLAGDLVLPDRGSAPVSGVLLLNRAAGDRRVYARLAERLAYHGLASLRLDLRGHGESTNLGRFVPGPEGTELIKDSANDVAAALAYLRQHPRIDAAHIGVVGASYSGEAMMQASRVAGPAAAYVGLSPGSLSDESIAAIDRIRVPWLLVVSRDERYLKEVVQALREQSRSAELLELGGTEHATRLLDAHPDLAERLAVWFSVKLRDD